jgi:hypothetical protein
MDPLGRDPLIRCFERHLYAENRSSRTVGEGVGFRTSWGRARAASDTAPRIPLQPTTSRSARPLRRAQ